jgi:hypothetical protein
MTPSVGSTVRLARGAKVYGQDYQFHSWVYDATFKLGELIGDRAVIYHNGACTGPCYRGDLIEV